MELAQYRRLFRVLFFIGAMVVCFGLGLYLMDYVAGGIVLLIIGISILVISFGITKFFLLMTMQKTFNPGSKTNTDGKTEEDRNQPDH